MNSIIGYLSVGLLFATTLGLQANEADALHALNDGSKWTEVFHDSGTGDWQAQWTLDGLEATVSNSEAGMHFTAGPEAFEDAHHAVLWTKQDFEGSVKIEYEYTRTDEVLQMTTILYILATGSGEPGYDTDISLWADKRSIPSMNTYYGNMHLYHVSYAGYGKKNTPEGNNYVSGRRYFAHNKLGGTQLKGNYTNTGLFQTGVPHQITVIKHDRNIYMHIKSPEKELYCHFVNKKHAPIESGKIGLRHMSTRSAIYKNFKVSTLTDPTSE